MERSELVKVLDVASRALANQDLIQINKCFAFDGETVRAYDETIGIIAPCEMSEKFAVSGNTLLGLLKHAQSQDVTVTLDKQDITIKTGRSTFKLPWFPIEDYLFTEPLDQWNLELNLTEDLLAGIKACLLTSSRDTAQPALLGVSINPEKSGTTLYSSDSDAISAYSLDVKTKAKSAYMMHNSFCDTLLDLAKETDCFNGTLSINKEWSCVAFENGYILYGRMIENENPLDFAGQIKKTLKSDPDFILVPVGLQHALARASVVADPETAKTVVTVEQGRMKLITTTSMGVVRDSLAFKEHPDVVANISSALMARSIELAVEMAVCENYCCFRSEKLFVITGNL